MKSSMKLVRNPGKEKTPKKVHAKSPHRSRVSNDQSQFLRLERAIGNRAMGQMIQAKLIIGDPNDKYEQEADRIAELVTRISEPKQQRGRACACGGTCSKCSDKLSGHARFPAIDSASPFRASRLSIGRIFRQEGANRRQPGSSSSPGNQPSSQRAAGSIFFCKPPVFDPNQIDSAVSTAKLWVGRVIPMLKLFGMGKLTDQQRGVVRVALQDNFNTTDPTSRLTLLPSTPLETILNNFIAIKRALNQPMDFFCTYACRSGDLAWVLGHPERFGLPKGTISICAEFFGCHPLKQASTIIHERAHEAIGAKDHAYETRNIYDSMATITALENAESYAVAARQIFHDGIYGPGLSCTLIGSRIRHFRHLQLTGKLQLPRAPEPTIQLPGLRRPTFQLPRP